MAPKTTVEATARSLTLELTALGLRPGMTVMMHASLRRLGPMQGGAHTLIEATRAAVGEQGTLLMVLGADWSDARPYDAQNSPVDTDDMGVLCEVFRRFPGVAVNDHPAARFAAIGPRSAHLLHPAPLHDYYGPGSVLERLTALPDAVVLRLGADIDTVTLTHHAEYLANVPDKRRVRRRYLRKDTGEVWIDSLDDTDGIHDWSGGDYFSQILLDFIADGRARVAPVGALTAELLPAAAFVRYATTWMERHLPG